MKATIIKYKDWKQQKGLLKHRIVLLAIQNITPEQNNYKIEHTIATQFSTHIEIIPEEKNKKHYFVWGHYYLTLKEACKDFKMRD